MEETIDNPKHASASAQHEGDEVHDGFTADTQGDSSQKEAEHEDAYDPSDSPLDPTGVMMRAGLTAGVGRW